MNNQNFVTPEHHSKLGPILGVLLILLVLVLGGLYLWGSSIDKDLREDIQVRDIPNNEPETPRAVADVQILGAVSSSDSLEAIEADLMSTQLDVLDQELTEMENELNAGIAAE